MNVSYTPAARLQLATSPSVAQPAFRALGTHLHCNAAAIDHGSATRDRNVSSGKLTTVSTSAARPADLTHRCDLNPRNLSTHE
ncbi:MAG: hypothetical protein RLZZ436_341 [Planctomycetota bacterium]